MSSIKKHFFFIPACLFLLAACSKDPLPLSNSKQLLSFSFRSSENPGLTENSQMFTMGNNVYITLPLHTDLTKLKPYFELSPNAHAFIGSTELISGQTVHNYSDVVKVTVRAQDESSTDYYVLARCGIWNVDKLVYSFMQKFSIPGISVSVAYDEALVYTQGYGYADQENHKKVESNTLFRLASVSKSFTSIAILRLLDEGKLSLSDRPFAQNGVLTSEFGTYTNSIAQITIRMLLEHTSGWQSDPMFSSVASGLNTHDIIAYTLSSVGLAHTPGTVHSYSNIGYCILGRIVETISGKDFETYLKSELFEQAGISDIHVGGTLSQRRSNESIYYSQDGYNGYANDMVRLRAVGGLIASTPELMRWLTHIDGGTKVPDIISPEIRRLMLTPSAVTNRYALGWRVNHSLYPGAAYHGGNLAGTGTIWVMGSNNNTHAAVLCNSRSYLSSFDDDLYVLIHDVIQQGYWSRLSVAQ